MKPKFFGYLLLFLALIGSFSSHAEVRLIHNSLTVDIHDSSLKEVLNDIQQQGDLNIVAFEETKIGNVRISKKFWDLPIEAGLDRLLSGWNYVISRNVSTGKITTLYLVSQRTDSPPLPDPVRTARNGISYEDTYKGQSQLSIVYEKYDDPESPNAEDEEEFNEFLEEPNFPSEEELANLPPDLREHLESLYRNDNG